MFDLVKITFFYKHLKQPSKYFGGLRITALDGLSVYFVELSGQCVVRLEVSITIYFYYDTE